MSGTGMPGIEASRTRIVRSMPPLSARTKAELLSEAREAAADGRLREMRRRLRLTQAESGARCEVSGPAWARWENGERRPTGRPALLLGRWLRSYGRAKA